jgi:hypothetical protein
VVILALLLAFILCALCQLWERFAPLLQRLMAATTGLGLPTLAYTNPDLVAHAFGLNSDERKAATKAKAAPAVKKRTRRGARERTTAASAS